MGGIEDGDERDMRERERERDGGLVFVGEEGRERG